MPLKMCLQFRDKLVFRSKINEISGFVRIVGFFLQDLVFDGTVIKSREAHSSSKNCSVRLLEHEKTSLELREASNEDASGP